MPGITQQKEREIEIRRAIKRHNNGNESGRGILYKRKVDRK